MSGGAVLSERPAGIYYKRLIKEWGLWSSPKRLAVILKEAKCYNRVQRKDLDIKIWWKDIAIDLGVTSTVMYNLAKGKSFPKPSLMEKLIKYFDLTTEEVK